MTMQEVESDNPITTHIHLEGHSHLSDLPLRAPEVPLYALERTQGERSIVHIGEVEIGGPEIISILGPCSIESKDLAQITGKAAKLVGAHGLRGGAFKPRTSPYSFMGHGEEALLAQREIADEVGMFVVTEATGESNVELVARYAEVIQTGARNAQSFEFLSLVGKVAAAYDRAVLYKRGPAMSVQEFLWGAEYILAAGCTKLMLCERGTVLANGSVDFDAEGVQAIKKLTHLPIIGDPTHAVKTADLVIDRAKKAISAGCDGIIVEFHPQPENAKSDGARALLPEQLIDLHQAIAESLPMGRTFQGNNSSIIFQ